MEYYVRFDDGEIDGPFSVERIRDMVAAGKLTPQAGVVEARGQGMSALRELLEWPTVSQLLGGSGSAIQLTPQAVGRQASSPVVKRYRDAYRVGAALVVLGDVIKKIGLAVGLIIALGGLSNGGFSAVAGVVFGVIAGGLFWIFGVVISAQGQILQSSLDTAVSNSPFLTDRERAEAMRLPASVADHRAAQ